MFVNNITFLVSVSQRLQFVKVQYLRRRMEYQLTNGIRHMRKAHSNKGLTVYKMFMDREFEFLIKHLAHVNLNTMSASEHVNEIERIIRIIEERAHSIYLNIPYNNIPGYMVIELIK